MAILPLSKLHLQTLIFPAPIPRNLDVDKTLTHYGLPQLAEHDQPEYPLQLAPMGIAEW